MPLTDAVPVRLADFTVRFTLPKALLADDRVEAIGAALNNLELRRRLTHLVHYEQETRPVFASAWRHRDSGGVRQANHLVQEHPKNRIFRVIPPYLDLPWV